MGPYLIHHSANLTATKPFTTTAMCDSMLGKPKFCRVLFVLGRKVLSISKGRLALMRTRSADVMPTLTEQHQRNVYQRSVYALRAMTVMKVNQVNILISFNAEVDTTLSTLAGQKGRKGVGGG